MKTNFIISLFYSVTFIYIVGCKNSIDHNKFNIGNDSTIQNKHKWLKQYALCSCIKFAFAENDSIKKDMSFTVLKEISDYGNPRLYNKIDSSSKSAALAITPPQVADLGKKKALLLKCLNYYESKHLDSLVRSFDKK